MRFPKADMLILGKNFDAFHVQNFLVVFRIQKYLQLFLIYFAKVI